MASQYAKTPRYALGSPLIPSRLRKRHDYCCGTLADTPGIDIGGISLGYSSAIDLYMPIIRFYPAENDQTAGTTATLRYLQTRPLVEHIDVCTIWKGLSFCEAELLFELHKTFKLSLEDLLADQIYKKDQVFRQQHSKDVARGAGNSTTIKMRSRFIFSRTRLINLMLTRLHTSQEYTIRPRRCDFEMLLEFFLTSCDYLVDVECTGMRSTAIDLLFQYPSSLIPKIPHKLDLEAGWSPDFLTFQDLAVLPREGQELRIIPRYNSSAVFRINGNQTDLRYSLETPLPWLTWDNELQGFTGFIPPYSEVWNMDGRYGKVYRPGRIGPHAVVNQLRVEIKALFTEFCSPSLCLQRTIRVRLTFMVIPWWAAASANAPDDQSIRLIMPETAQRYVDDLFSRAVSGDIELRRIQAAPLQARHVTGLRSALDKNDTFSTGRSSRNPSSLSFTFETKSRKSTFNLQSDEETITSEEDVVSSEVSRQSTSETFTEGAINTTTARTWEASYKSLHGIIDHCDRSITSTPSNLTLVSEGLGLDEGKQVLPGNTTEPPPLTFHNRYYPLHELKENAYGNSDGSDDDDSTPSELTISSSERMPQHFVAKRIVRSRRQSGSKMVFGVGALSMNLCLDTVDISSPVHYYPFTLPEDDLSLFSDEEVLLGSVDHAIEAMINFGF